MEEDSGMTWEHIVLLIFVAASIIVLIVLLYMALILPEIQ